MAIVTLVFDVIATKLMLKFVRSKNNVLHPMKAKMTTKYLFLKKNFVLSENILEFDLKKKFVKNQTPALLNFYVAVKYCSICIPYLMAQK